MRGENNLATYATGAAIGSSPHARGKLWGECPFTGFDGLIPACAGKTSDDKLGTVQARAHPRMRGENRVWFVG